MESLLKHLQPCLPNIQLNRFATEGLCILSFKLFTKRRKKFSICGLAPFFIHNAPKTVFTLCNIAVCPRLLYGAAYASLHTICLCSEAQRHSGIDILHGFRAILHHHFQNGALRIPKAQPSVPYSRFFQQPGCAGCTAMSNCFLRQASFSA